MSKISPLPPNQEIVATHSCISWPHGSCCQFLRRGLTDRNWRDLRKEEPSACEPAAEGDTVWNTGRSHFTPGLQSWKMSCKSNTKFPFKTVYFLRIRGLTTSSCSVWLYHYWTNRHVVCVCVYLYTAYTVCKRRPQFHSDITVAVLLQKQFSMFCNTVNIIMNCMYANMSESNIMACQQFNILFQVGSLRIISLQYWLHFTLSAVGDVDIHFSFILVMSQSCWRSN
jgi:hypothetical protein